MTNESRLIVVAHDGLMRLSSRWRERGHRAAGRVDPARRRSARPQARFRTGADGDEHPATWVESATLLSTRLRSQVRVDLLHDRPVQRPHRHGTAPACARAGHSKVGGSGWGRSASTWPVTPPARCGGAPRTIRRTADPVGVEAGSQRRGATARRSAPASPEIRGPHIHGYRYRSRQGGLGGT
jgi:hypothetical protein